MSVEDLKAQAARLGLHLTQKHGIKLKHAAILEALAASYGARDWNTLQSQHRPSLMERVFDSFKQRLPVPFFFTPRTLSLAVEPGVYHLGVAAQPWEYAAITEDSMRCHMLICAQDGQGFQAFSLHLMSQQITKGGGLLFLNDAPDATPVNLLEAVAEHVGRGRDFCTSEDFFQLDVSTILRKNQIGVVSRVKFTGPPNALLRNTVRERLQAALVERRAVAEDIPFMVVIPSMQWYLDATWAPIWAQARAFGVSLVVQSDLLPGHGRCVAEDGVHLLSNTMTKVFFRPNSVESLYATATLIRALAPDYASLSALKQELAELQPGEFIGVKPGHALRGSACQVLLS